MKKVDFLIKVRGDPLASHTVLCSLLYLGGFVVEVNGQRVLSGRNENVLIVTQRIMTLDEIRGQGH